MAKMKEFRIDTELNISRIYTIIKYNNMRT